MAPKVDPTGYEDALATIPKGQLSERQQRIAAGLAMIREGSSIKKAAEVCRIPKTTMWEYHHSLRSLSDPEIKVDRDMKAIQAATYDIAQIASEKIIESLSDNAEDWKPGDLVKAYGVAVDKIGILSSSAAPGTDGVANLVSALLEAGSVTITPHPPDHAAIDVEATGHTDEEK